MIWVIAFFTILFGRTYPDGLFKFMTGTLRWNQNVMAYALFLDRYPPYSMDEGAYEASRSRSRSPPSTTAGSCS